MYCHNHTLYEPEPEFSKYETYYLTSSDDRYSSVGSYGEPLQYHQEEWRDESHFFSVRDEEGDGFLSRAWYLNARSNQQGNDATGSPCWGEDLLPHGCSYSGYEAECGPEKADNANSDGAFYSFSQDVRPPPCSDDDQWCVWGFEFGFNEDYHDHGDQKHDTAYDFNWNAGKHIWSLALPGASGPGSSGAACA